MSLFGGMLDQLLDIVRVDRVHDIEEILPRRKTPLWNLVGEVLHELTNLLHVRPQVLYGQLVIIRNCDKFD